MGEHSQKQQQMEARNTFVRNDDYSEYCVDSVRVKEWATNSNYSESSVHLEKSLSCDDGLSQMTSTLLNILDTPKNVKEDFTMRNHQRFSSFENAYKMSPVNTQYQQHTEMKYDHHGHNSVPISTQH